MKKKNILAIILVFIFIDIIKSIGIENIPFPVIATLFVLCMGAALAIALRYRGDKKEQIYLLTMTILIIIIAIMIVIAVIIQNNYPQLSEQVKPIFISLMAILFVALLIAIFANAIYKSKNK